MHIYTEAPGQAIVVETGGDHRRLMVDGDGKQARCSKAKEPKADRIHPMSMIKVLFPVFTTW